MKSSIKFSKTLLTEETFILAEKLYRELDRDLKNILDSSIIDEILSSILCISRPTTFNFIPGQILEALNNIRDKHDSKILGKLCKFIVLCLIERLPETLMNKKLPQSIIDLYPEVLGITINTIRETDDKEYLVGGENFTKDFRITSGRSFPAGAQIFDALTYIPKSVYRNRGYKNNIKSLGYVIFNLKGLEPLVRIHTDSRNLDDFNESGWNNCYLRIAEFMKKNSNIKGMVGTSWFYDPQLETISPRLAYLRKVPQNNGAHLIIDGTSQADIDRATLTSKTRKKLYEDGMYMPTCCTLIWSRNKMLKWANSFLKQSI